MTTVQLPPAALPGRGGQSGTRESSGSGAGGGATAFGALFQGHLSERHGAVGARPDQRFSAADAGAVQFPGTTTAASAPTPALVAGPQDGVAESSPAHQLPTQADDAPGAAASHSVAMTGATTLGAFDSSAFESGPVESGELESATAGSGTAQLGTAESGARRAVVVGTTAPADTTDGPRSAAPTVSPGVDAVTAQGTPAPDAAEGERGPAAEDIPTAAAAVPGAPTDATTLSAVAEPARGTSPALPADQHESVIAAAGAADTSSTEHSVDEVIARSADQLRHAGSDSPRSAPTADAPTGRQVIAGSTAATGAGIAAPHLPLPGVWNVTGAPAPGSAAGPIPSGTGSSAVSPAGDQDQAPVPGLPARPAGADPEVASSRTEPVAVPQQAAPAAHTGTAAPVAAPAPAHMMRQPVPLPQQLGASAFAVVQSAAEADGRTSTITVAVAPDDLGPITIRASLSAEGTRLEFFSATDGGREALRHALPELRREAASSGLSAALDLGTGTPDDSGREGLRDELRPSRDGRLRSDTPPAPVQPTPWAGQGAMGSATLDLFA